MLLGEQSGKAPLPVRGEMETKGLAWAVREQQRQVHKEGQAQEPRTVRLSRGTVPWCLNKTSRSGNSSESWPLRANQWASEEQEKVSDKSASLDLRYLDRHSCTTAQARTRGNRLGLNTAPTQRQPFSQQSEPKSQLHHVRAGVEHKQPNTWEGCDEGCDADYKHLRDC